MIILGFGSNLNGAFGAPYQSINTALVKLAAFNIEIKCASELYYSRAQSDHPQPDFLNAVAAVHTTIPAYCLLKILKTIEAQGGRRKVRSAQRWRPRALDIDIIDYKGLIFNWKMRVPVDDMPVILPHPRAHQRAFVLKPLSDIAPFWHHPVLGLTASELLKRPEVRQTGAIMCRWNKDLARQR